MLYKTRVVQCSTYVKCMTLRYFKIKKNNIKHKVGPEIRGLMVQSVAQWRWPGSFVGSLGVPFLFAPGARVFSSSWAGHVGYVGAPRIWAWFEKRKPGGGLPTIAPNRSKSLSTVWKCWWFRNKALLFGVETSGLIEILITFSGRWRLRGTLRERMRGALRASVPCGWDGEYLWIPMEV